MRIRLLVVAFLILFTGARLSALFAQFPQGGPTRLHSHPAAKLSETGQLPDGRTVTDDSLGFHHQPVNLPKAKAEAEQLAALAKELRELLNQPKTAELHSKVVVRAQKIGKLAKKIGEEVDTY
jgi:hypothetical protein